MGNNELLLAISDMMDQKLDTINVKMDTLENKFTAKIDAVENKLTAKIDAVDERLSAAVTKNSIILENMVLPRLDHIEQCYLDTSERYINETGRINGLVLDVQVIKSVVQDHSEQLRKIS